MSDGTTTWTNTYNSAGLRTSRTDGTTTYTYIYENGKLSAIKRNDLNMWIFYDDHGPVTIKYGTGTFHYVTNLQGDVVAIVGKDGQTAVEYTYDAWGQVTSITGVYAYNLGIHNPILYRGYVYDHETGLYYCQSRYYDPETGRWLNADAFTSAGQGFTGNNMFAYCNNNPVLYSDESGLLPVAIYPIAQDGIAGKPGSNWRKRIAVLYDGRMNTYVEVFGHVIIGEKGFRNQGRELLRRLTPYHTVESYPFETMGEFVQSWNSLHGSYDEIYIIAHGTTGALHCAGHSLAEQGKTYSYSDLQRVNAGNVYLYCCNGATVSEYTQSIAQHFSMLTGAEIWAVKNGKLNFSLFCCVPILQEGGTVCIIPGS